MTRPTSERIEEIRAAFAKMEQDDKGLRETPSWTRDLLAEIDSLHATVVRADDVHEELLRQLDEVTLREQVTAFHEAMGLPVEDKPTVPPADVVRLRARLIAEEFFETMEAMFHGSHDFCVAATDLAETITRTPVSVDMELLADGLADLDYVIEGARLCFGIDGASIAAEVQRANMTKIGGPVREDGKRLKPPGWVGPDIKGVLKKQGWEA